MASNDLKFTCACGEVVGKISDLRVGDGIDMSAIVTIVRSPLTCSVILRRSMPTEAHRPPCSQFQTENRKRIGPALCDQGRQYQIATDPPMALLNVQDAALQHI